MPVKINILSEIRLIILYILVNLSLFDFW